MRMMLELFRAYPLASFVMLVALLLSGLVEGLGVSALLPLLKLAMGSGEGIEDAPPPSEFEQFLLDLFATLGIPVTLGALSILIVVAAFLKAVLLLIAKRQAGYTAAQVATDLRLEVLRNMMRSRWNFFLHQPAGKISNALATEAQRASAAFLQGTFAITFFIQAVVYGAVAVAISWQAMLIGLAGGALIIGLMHFLVRITRKAGRKHTELMKSLMSHVTDMLQSVKPLKAMARENQVDHLLEHDTNRINKAMRRKVLAEAGLYSGQELLFVGLIALGVYVALGVLQIEFAVAAVLAVTLGRCFALLGKVQRRYQKLAQNDSAYWSLKETSRAAQEEMEHLGGHIMPSLDEGIHLRKVGMVYDGKRVFTDLDLDIPARRITTVIGPSGSGKTTIIDLVIGLIRPDAGEIFLDDAALGEVDLKAWRRMVGYVPQETVLLHDSVLHNVTLGDPAISEARAVEALRKAGAWDFVSALPHGLQSDVGERGGRLSGGQRQRIAIARALINDPTLLILDEATSALDPESEAAIIATLRKLRDELTILTISHNSSLAAAADLVHRLEPGGRLTSEWVRQDAAAV